MATKSLPRLNSLEDYVMVAAIDFGTTFSGYAFSFTNKKDDIMINKSWGGYQSYKTPTCVMVDSANKFHAFGYDAEQRYTQVEENDSYQLYRHFKMMLHGSQKLTNDSTITSIGGKMTPALEVFAMALRYLKDHLIEVVSLQTTTLATAEHIRWVITVPAIWNEEAKQFMRKAALKAGIIQTVDSRRLLIALEPEAASVFCRSLNIKQFIASSSGKSLPSFEPGIKYLVIDAGGGTVDLTAHEVLASGGVKEIHTASGGAWGGTKVDQDFVKLLEEVLGSKFVHSFQKECPQQWLEFMVNFERQKRSIKPDSECKLNIIIPMIMDTKCKEICGKGIDKVIEEANKPGVYMSKNGFMIFNYDVVVSLFQSVIDNIVSHIEKLLREPAMNGCSYFMLVGGFAESAMLQKAFYDKFSSRVNVLVPEEAQLSVIKGAVVFGHRPDDIKIRKARYTYGTDCRINFIPEKHDWKHREVIEGKEWCRNVFSTFVKKGSDVQVGYTRSNKYIPTWHGQPFATIRLFQSDNVDVQYVDEEGCKLLMQLRVEMPNVEKDMDRQVEIKMTFGGTEIQVDGYDVESGCRAEATIDFL